MPTRIREANFGVYTSTRRRNSLVNKLINVFIILGVFILLVWILAA